MDPVGGVIRVAGVILYRQGKVLLQHRDDDPSIVYPGAWAILGGHLEDGEEPEAGALREIEEELGLALKRPLPLFFHGIGDGRERFVYAAPLPVPPENLTLTEGQGMALLGPEDLDRYDVVPVHRDLLRRFFEQRLA